MDASELIRTLSAGRNEISEDDLVEVAAVTGVSLLTAQKLALEVGVWPTRYYRNFSALTPEEQLRLLNAQVLLVGLGGLGGYVLELLARMGVGCIIGADGDSFEPRNMNRQLLCNVETIGLGKADIAAERVALVNPAVEFKGLPEFVTARTLRNLAASADLVIDALGGLRDRKAVQTAAAEAGVPLVSAGVAGFGGWVAVIEPGQTGPADFFGSGTASGDGVELEMGTLAPAVSAAAAMQCAEVLKALTGRARSKGILFFDLMDQTFMKMV